MVFLLYTLVSESIVSSSTTSTMFPMLLTPSARTILPVTIFSPVYLVCIVPINLTFSLTFPIVLILVVSFTQKSDIYVFMQLTRLSSSIISSGATIPSAIYSRHSSSGIRTMTSLVLPSYLVISLHYAVYIQHLNINIT